MRKIFIIDDDVSMREVLYRYISKYKYEVSSFAAPEEALACIDSDSPLAVISDINMPGMSGLEMAAALKDRGVNCPVILMSADITGEISLRAEELGIKYLFRKPIKELRRLIDAVEDVRKDTQYNETNPDSKDERLKFLEEISHELRTPLTSIKMALEGLRSEPFLRGTRDSSKLISIGERNLDRIIALVENKLHVLKQTID